MKIAFCLLCFALASASGQTRLFVSDRGRTALLELYTSEGCSSCPAADKWLGSLRNDPGLWLKFVPIEFHVNYWDHLGWKDRLSTPAYTAREYALSKSWGASNVYTPCFVKNGGEWEPMHGLSWPLPVGKDVGYLRIEVSPNGECVGQFEPSSDGTSGAMADDLCVAVLGMGIPSHVTSGENAGTDMEHQFVVIGFSQFPLNAVAGISSEKARFQLPTTTVDGAKRLALAAWIARRGGIAPVQAVGGWLN
jgi:hypothetical protein